MSHFLQYRVASSQSLCQAHYRTTAQSTLARVASEVVFRKLGSTSASSPQHLKTQDSRLHPSHCQNLRQLHPISRPSSKAQTTTPSLEHGNLQTPKPFRAARLQRLDRSCSRRSASAASSRSSSLWFAASGDRVGL